MNLDKETVTRLNDYTRIIYFKAASKLSTDQIMTKLGSEPLYSLLMNALQIEFPDTFFIILI